MDTDGGLVSGTFLTARAFERLYLQHNKKVFGYAARRVGADLAEELTAQVFAEAWAARERFDRSRGAPVVWLLGIATNLLRRQRRSEMTQLRAYRRSGVDRPHIDEEATVLDRVVARVGWAQVAEVLAELPEADREVLTLAGWAGLSYGEIAVVLDVSVGTVKSRLSRARARLVARVGPVAVPGVDES